MMATVTALLRASFSRRTLFEFGYLLLAAPLAIIGFAFVAVSTVLGVGLAVTFIGLPLLAASGRLARAFGALDRRQARNLLAETIKPPLPLVSSPGFFGWFQSALTDRVAWRTRLYLLVKLPVALFGCYASVVVLVQGLAWSTYPLWWQLSSPGPTYHGSVIDPGALIGRGGNGWFADSWPTALLVMLLGFALLLIFAWVVRAMAWLQRLLMRALLGRGSRRERLLELEAARTQVVDNSAATLRRIERDLHDGTQAQLAVLAMTLGQAKEKLEHRPDVPFDPAGALGLVDTAHRQTKEALTELRDIARGIHPPALDVGLDAALTTLVSRSAIPAVFHADLTARSSQAIETIAYYSVAELLANAAKHSEASRILIEARTAEGWLWLQVSDDGIGGARPGAGSGLIGLHDRVRAVDGQLRISSPVGGPTTIDVQLPVQP
jgi:signal transduction histidine kinase